jgi:hypothetical protein
MLSKSQQNYYLDILLLIVGATCALTGVILGTKPHLLMPFFIAIHYKVVHEWIGYLVIVLGAIHLLLHLDWIKFMTKSTKK